MKRIIITVTNDLELDQRMHKTALNLSHNGYDVLLIGRQTSKSGAISRIYPVKRFRLLFQRGLLFYAAYNLRLFCWLVFHKWDAVLACDMDSLPAAYFAKRVRRKQIVFDSHELFSEVPELQHKPRVRRFWVHLENYFLPKLKYAYTVSQSIANYYYEKFGVKMDVIRNLPMKNANQENYQISTEKPFVIYQGTLNLGRGIEKMIDAMEFMPNYNLVIAGDGPLQAELQNRVSHSFAKERILFVGRLSFEKLHGLTKKAVLGLSLEQDLGLNYRFALPNKLFDYWHAGIPAIVSDLPEMKQLMEKTQAGITVSNHIEPENLAKEINTLITNSAGYEIMKKAAQKAASEYHWENESKCQLEIFRSIFKFSEINA
ncbi:MAG: glycosyltransferase [Bacteroidota bacterium]|nr:glycosyltransferase [Bacteroidota bacterium]